MISFQGAVDQTRMLWSAFHTPSNSCSIISSGYTWHHVKLQGSAESETWSIENVHICTATLWWTHLVSPVIAESFRIGPAVTADTHLASWHTVDTTHPQLSSLGMFTLGSEMKEYAGGFSQIVTGYKVLYRHCGRKLAQLSICFCRRVPANSSNLSSFCLWTFL